MKNTARVYGVEERCARGMVYALLTLVLGATAAQATDSQPTWSTTGGWAATLAAPAAAAAPNSAKTCNITKAVADMNLGTLTLHGGFCVAPTVSYGRPGGSFAPLPILSSSASRIEADLSGYAEDGSAQTVVQCPDGRKFYTCRLDVTVGVVGPVGPTGPQGIQGQTGATGAQGIQGSMGSTGPQGAQGAIGATGSQGIAGNTGATGPQGVPGPSAMSDGTAAAPGLPFTLDGNTGIWRPGADTLALTTGGVSRFEIRADGDVNLVRPDGALRIAGEPFLHQWGGGGDGNTAVGRNALISTTHGAAAVAIGESALRLNTAGYGNTAAGYHALSENTLGHNNSAIGYEALGANTNGGANVAIGFRALLENTTGGSNVAIGNSALSHCTHGASNIAVGMEAGLSVTTGSNNVFIDNQGVAGDSDTIRIGDDHKLRTFIDGIRGVTTGHSNAVDVMIDSDGQLGTVSSSRRFKWDIRDMADASDRLMQLRPVTFRYNQAYADGSQPIQYGLIAEEVAEVYPDLVVHGADGQVETVQYWKLAPMMLNEIQKLKAENAELEARLLAIESLLAREASSPASGDKR